MSGSKLSPRSSSCLSRFAVAGRERFTLYSLMRCADDVTCRSQLHAEMSASSRREHQRRDVLPGGAHVGGLGVVRRVPRADAELEPALGVDRHVGLPEPPGVVVLQRRRVSSSADARSSRAYLLGEVFRLYGVPNVAAMADWVLAEKMMREGVRTRRG